MKRNIETSSRNNVDASRSTRFQSRKGHHPNAVPYSLLQKLFIGGVFVFAIGIIVTYSHLMKIEANNHIDRGLRIGGRPDRFSMHSTGQKVHPRKKDDTIPGRAFGSETGQVRCDEDISQLVSYWSDPRSDDDISFQSPFLEAPAAYRTKSKSKRPRYLSFEPDCGGWNNIRMEFEIMVVLAAATGRTLVLPPDNPMYLLNKAEGEKRRGLQTFFQGFGDIVDTITTEELFQKEIIEGKNYPLPRSVYNRTRLMNSTQKCDWVGKSDRSCVYLSHYLTQVADYVPNWTGEKDCLIMDDKTWFKDESHEKEEDDQQQQYIKKFCAKRKPSYYNAQIHDAPLLHFHTYYKNTRLLLHFYAFIHFTNPKVGNYYKRLVRDRVRYSDEIFCAAGKLVKSLLEEAGPDTGYFAMHIRRGDFQWPKMRISSEEWYENTKSWLEPDANRIIYIATDETNSTFFDPLRKHYRLRFLDDYAEMVGLSELDPNFVGMIDQVVASRATVFVGTYFSSFSAYIGRMRAYHGMSANTMYYSHPSRWNETHHWAFPHPSYSAREYPLGWAGIDGDDEPSEKDFY